MARRARSPEQPIAVKTHALLADPGQRSLLTSGVP